MGSWLLRQIAKDELRLADSISAQDAISGSGEEVRDPVIGVEESNVKTIMV